MLPDRRPSCSTRTTAPHAPPAAAARRAQEGSIASCQRCFASRPGVFTGCAGVSLLPATLLSTLRSWPAFLLVQNPSDGWGNQGRAGVAVWLPPGSYRVTQTLNIAWSNVVLRGAGVRPCPRRTPASAPMRTAQPAADPMWPCWTNPPALCLTVAHPPTSPHTHTQSPSPLTAAPPCPWPRCSKARPGCSFQRACRRCTAAKRCGAPAAGSSCESALGWGVGVGWVSGVCGGGVGGWVAGGWGGAGWGREGGCTAGAALRQPLASARVAVLPCGPPLVRPASSCPHAVLHTSVPASSLPPAPNA